MAYLFCAYDSYYCGQYYYKSYARYFNDDISTWDTSRVTRMWDTSRVTRMYNMFMNAQDFNQDLSGWDIRAVTGSQNYMFYSAYDFDQYLGWCFEYDVSFSSAAFYSTGCGSMSGCGITQKSVCETPSPTARPTIAPTATFAPTLEGCSLYVVGPKGASQGNVVAYGNSLRNYELSFRMELASDWSITGSWQSIFHIGDSNGQRLPGIWFHGTENKMVVAQSHSYCDTCSMSSTTGTFTFTGGDPGEGLDFTGDFVYAVDISGPGGVTVDDAVFTSDGTTPGFSVTAQYERTTWYSRPGFGSSSNDGAFSVAGADGLGRGAAAPLLVSWRGADGGCL